MLSLNVLLLTLYKASSSNSQFDRLEFFLAVRGPGGGNTSDQSPPPSLQDMSCNDDAFSIYIHHTHFFFAYKCFITRNQTLANSGMLLFRL